MFTRHAMMLHREAEKALGSDPRWGPLLVRILGLMRGGHYPEPFLAAVVQKPEGDFNIYDAFAFGQFEAMLMEGKIAFAALEVDGQPQGDHMAEVNDGPLRRLVSPWRGEFFGGRGVPDDGYLEWTAPATFHAAIPGTQTSRPVVVPPSHVPLEVGTTAASRTMLHLGEDGGVARWPYNCRSLWVFLRLDGPACPRKGR